MRALCSVALALAACDRPSPLVICHNANCTSPDPSRDDTPEALAGSFALRFNGRPVLDGIEIDTFWHGAQGRCLFAHDIDNPAAILASEAAQLIADHLATTTVVSHGERFYLFIELKGFVGASLDDRHTPEQFIAHADCAIDVAQRVARSAAEAGHSLTVGFIAGVPTHHETLRGNPRWPSLEDDPDVETLLIADTFAPYLQVTDFNVPVDVIEYHPAYMTQARRETYRSLGYQLAQWSYVSTAEAFDAIERWEPRFAITNEALLLRRWIEN
jgi:hypothetical protein